MTSPSLQAFAELHALSPFCGSISPWRQFEGSTTVPVKHIYSEVQKGGQVAWSCKAGSDFDIEDSCMASCQYAENIEK